MKRIEKYILGARVIEVTDSKVIATGYGFLCPRYEETFKLDELLPEFSVVYNVNVTLLRPVALISLFCCVAAIVINLGNPPMSQIEIINQILDIVVFVIFYLALIGPLTTVALLLIRIRWVTYKYSSGVVAFSVGPGLFDRKGQVAFCKRLSEIIENRNQG